MWRGLRLAAAGSAAVALLCASAPGYADDKSGGSITGETADDSVVVGAHIVTIPDAVPDNGVSQHTQQALVPAYEENDVICALRQYADEDGALGNEETDLCPEDEDGPTAADVVALVAQEFQRLPIAAPSITHQPDADWALVNMDFIVLTDAQVQVLETTILGVPVAVRATPVHYAWDFGDGGTLATTDPGSPYPDHTVSHVYTSSADAVTVTLTTSWQGELQIAGSGSWLPIAGMATTTSVADPVEIVAMDVRLVPND
ncbi:hypothetical protein GCM10027212_24000 [Actinotalea caeni]